MRAREDSQRARRVRVFLQANQGHGLGKVRFQKTEQLSSNRNLFLTIQHNASCLQNGVRLVPQTVPTASDELLIEAQLFPLELLLEAMLVLP